MNIKSFYYIDCMLPSIKEFLNWPLSEFFSTYELMEKANRKYLKTKRTKEQKKKTGTREFQLTIYNQRL